MGIIKIIEGSDESKKDTLKLCQRIVESEGFDVKEINHKIIFEPYPERETSILFQRRKVNEA